MSVAAGNEGIGLLRPRSWTWTVSGLAVLGIAAYQHFKCPVLAAPTSKSGTPPRPLLFHPKATYSAIRLVVLIECILESLVESFYRRIHLKSGFHSNISGQ